MSTSTLRTPEQAAEWLVANGISIVDFARQLGVSRYTIHDILRGKRVGRRGQAHKAAVALGIKANPKSLRV